MKKRLLLPALGIVAVLILIWWADLGEVTIVLMSLSPRIILVLFMLQILTLCLIACQWQLIVQAIGYRVSLGTVFHVLMFGTFVESVTPAAKVGGEAVKTIKLRDLTGMSMAESVAVTAIQKTLSILPFLALCLVAVAHVLRTAQTDHAFSTPLLVGLAFVAVLTLLLVLALIRPDLLRRCLPQRARAELKNYHLAVSRMLVHPGQVAGQVLLSVSIWLLFATKALIVTRALGQSLGFSQAASAAYISYMLGLVPLLPGGLGAMEGSMTAVLTSFGVPVATGVAASLSLRLVSFWLVFIFSALWLGIYYLITILSIFRTTKPVKSNCFNAR